MNTRYHFAATSIAAALLLSGCQDKPSKPLTRIDELGTPEPKTVSAVAEQQAKAAAAARPVETATSGSIAGIPAPPAAKVHQGGNVLAVAGVAFTLPAGWTQQPPASKMRAAQYSLPGKAGDAELYVSWFGPGQGGNVQQNVQRWFKQFSSDDPTTTALPGEMGTLENGDLKITMVRTQGTFDPGAMSPGDKTPKKGYGLFGLVVEGGPEGNIFVKATGPAATITEQGKNLEQFAQSARKSTFQ